MRGGGVVGIGSYGVVHYNSPIPCNKSQTDNHLKGVISKLMLKEDAWEEYEQTKSIHKKVKELVLEEYFVFPTGPPCPSNFINETTDLKVIDDRLKKYQIGIKNRIDDAIKYPLDYSILHIPYAGDSTLNHVNGLFLSNDMNAMNTLKDQIIDAFEYGLLPLNQNRIYHKDLKLDNMVVLDNQVKIIDWGLGLDMKAEEDKYKNKNLMNISVKIPGYVQYNAPLSAPMIVSLKGTYYDNIAFANVINHIENKDGPTHHYDHIIRITELALKVLDIKKTVTQIIIDYENKLQKYRNRNRKFFIEEYHRVVDIWGLVIVFGDLLKMYENHLSDNAKQKISEAVLELYTLESIEMKDEQIKNILRMLRAIDFTTKEPVQNDHVFMFDNNAKVDVEGLKEILNYKSPPTPIRENKKRLYSTTGTSLSKKDPNPPYKKTRRGGRIKQTEKRQRISKIRKTKQDKKQKNRRSRHRRNRRSRR